MAEHSTKRLFIAIEIPEAHRTLLGDVEEPVKGVRWMPPSQFHLTLRFLGDTCRDHQKAIIRRFRAISVESFILPLEEIGVFPGRGRPRNIWAGVGRGHPRLYQLRQQIDDALLAAGTEIDLRIFSAHITLGSCARANPGAVVSFLRKHRDFRGPPFRVDRFNLYSSRLTPSGAIHSVEESFPLRG